MIGYIIKNFSRSCINSKNLLVSNKNAQLAKDYRSSQSWNHIWWRNLSTDPTVNPFDTDDYVVPFQEKQHRKPTKRQYWSLDELYEKLRFKCRMNEQQINAISKAMYKMNRYDRKFSDEALDVCLENGIKKSTLVEYPWLLATDAPLLKTKINVLTELKLKCIEDMVPLLKISLPRLLRIAQVMDYESKLVPGGNRIYLLSEQLKLEPKVVSEYISKRLFVLEMDYDIFFENLKNLVKYGVSPLNILGDLWAFRYTPKSVKYRLERVKKTKREKIMPWMVRCPEEVLHKTLTRTVEDRKLLGEGGNIVDYVANRLGYDNETMAAIMAKHPATLRVRVTKVKEILDYLLGEGYKPYEIAQVIRVLCHSFETTKQRLEELKSYDCRPSTLLIVCRSKREYEKFIKSWLEVRNKIKKLEE